MKGFIYVLFLFGVLSCTEHKRFQLLNPEETGIGFENTIVETDSLHVMNFEYIYNGGGVGVVDLNNDGKQDLIFTGNQVTTKIYLNKGDFKFEDITANFPGLSNEQWHSGVSIVDINSDGWNDLYFTCTAYKDPEKRKNRLWVNQGLNGDTPMFKEMAEEYGIADQNYSVQASFFDYDNDGDLDLYVLNNFVTERLSASYREKILDGSAISNDKLYRNDGNDHFSDVTIEAGIVFEGFGLGLAMGDVNKDGYPDIYISNDYISNDLLYINQRDGTFKNEIDTYLSYQTKSSMGDDMADINNDGYPDIFTMDMMPEYYYKKKQTINGFSYIFYFYDEKFGYEHQYLRNMLHLHNGFQRGEMLPYSEVGQMMGIYQTEWSWSPLFADYDNDGDKDLLITNGYPKDLTDKDWTRYKAQVFGSVASAAHVMSKAPAAKAINFAFENKGNYTFDKVSDQWFDVTKSYSYGAAFVDLDNDGDLDYVVNNLNDPAFIYKNNTNEQQPKKSNYLKINLLGKAGNTQAIGAKIELWAEGNYQFQEHFMSRGYISSVDPTVHFGLAEIQKVDSIKVTWPGGTISVIRNIQANQLIKVNEEESLKSSLAVTSKDDIKYLFEKKNNVIDYVHQQNDFIDYTTFQNVIPHKFSQIGPRMAKGDIDKDGYDDIIIGSTNNLPTKVFFGKGTEFINTEVEGLTTLKQNPEADIAIVDYDNDGDNDIVAIAGGYENPKEEDYIHYLYENENGKFISKKLPIAGFPASVIRAFDYNHDGYIDLFIGSRVKKDMFPLAADSWIILNDHGQYKKENALNFNLGMVTDAIWSDYDGDGWEDLIITREWNSIAVLKNKEGQGLSSQDLPELESKHGIWYSISNGDFDMDGDQDYIVGNLGENHRFTVSDIYPLHVYAVDLDMNGTIDPIATGYWKDPYDVMKEFPINYLDELMAQSSFFAKKFQNYASFSYASMDSIFDESIRKRIIYTFKANTASSYILWNEKGSFRFEKLPESIQVSPIKKMIVHDFNGDTYPDVLLGGNDYTYDVSTGFYDANKGIVLLSKGDKSGFEVLEPAQSGILLQGMVESMLYFEGDTSLVVTGFNRDSVSVYQHISK